MINKNDMGISKFISLVLRHKPQEANLTLDEYGYTNVSDLLTGLNGEGYKANLEDLQRIVREDDKQRYSFSSDGNKIRANQGHSVKVNLELQSIEPPNVLYHGTAQRFKESIYKMGITKQKRQYVHLSADIDTAIKVGRRHGEPIIFTIDSKKMYEDGYNFYLSDNKVWLTEYVSPKYIKIMED